MTDGETNGESGMQVTWGTKITWGSAKDLSEEWKVPLSTIYQLSAEEDGPPAVRVGRHWRYPMEECNAWLRARRELTLQTQGAGKRHQRNTRLSAK